MRIAIINNGKYEVWNYDNLDEAYDFLAEAVCYDEVTIISVTDKNGYPITNWKKIIYGPF